MAEEYGLFSEFDIQKHKETFVNYLEVIIGANGKVVYAVPSHQQLLEKLACLQLGVSREELGDMCPPEYYCDYMDWLCSITGAMAVWNDFCKVHEVSRQQIATLKALKLNGLYHGAIPRILEKEC